MLSGQRLMAFAATGDAARARRFYEGTLGLRFVSDDEHTLVFDANGTTLRIQRVGAHEPHPFSQLGWSVEDLAATVHALSARGLRFERYGFLTQDELGVWHAASGAQVAWFKDPDGNTVSITQR